LSFYSYKFTKLRVDNAHGVAPHKPTLLLAVIELFEQKKVEHNQVYLSPELIATFLKYWSNLVTSKHRSDIALPFFHLTGGRLGTVGRLGKVRDRRGWLKCPEDHCAELKGY
jgi:putative restriction endonuclease